MTFSGTLTILHSESSAGWGGQENRTLLECVGLKRLGARVIILCKPRSRLYERAVAAGIEVRTHAMRSNRDLSALVFALRLLRKESVDVICTHSGDDSLLLAVAGRLSSRRPAVVRTRHIALPITSKATYSLLPHRVVAVSEHVRRYLVDEKGIDGKKVVSIPTGIDIKRFDPDSTPDTLRAELGLKDAPLVGTVAILRRKKGHHILLDAIPLVLREVPGAIFLFAGDGPQKENIEARVRELGIEKSVRLLGLRRDVPVFLKGIDIFALPTLQEALGTSFLEASAMKKPVIGSRVGGVPEVVIHERTGLLAEPMDPSGLAAAIIRLLNDGALAKRMGEEGRKMVEADYTADKMVERLYSFYSGLAGKRT